MIEHAYISARFQEWEGRKTRAYIPCYVRPEAQPRVGSATANYTGLNGIPADFEAMGASGVTIGTGVDLGQQTLAGLQAMGVPADLLVLFTPYMGLTRQYAIQALHKAPFTIFEAQCDALDLAVHSEYVRRVARLYDSTSPVPFAHIPKEAQAVTAHLFYHLGGPRKYPNTWKALVRQDWQVAADKLRNGALWSGPYDYGRASEGRLLTQIPGVHA